MIKAIVFDLDDTLISEKQYVKSGFKIIANEIAQKYELNESKVFERIENLFEITSKNVFNRILESYEIKYEKNEIDRLIKIYRNHEPNIEFFSDVIPTILKLKEEGYKIGMITDGYKETQNKKLDILKCRKLFDAIVITDELGKEFWKPHKKPYEIIKERLKCKYNEMIYIGDNEEKDFIIAKRLGIKTYKILRENRVYADQENIEYKSDIEIKKLSELLENGLKMSLE